jgi:hypothetical protein
MQPLCACLTALPYRVHGPRQGLTALGSQLGTKGPGEALVLQITAGQGLPSHRQASMGRRRPPYT